MKKLLVIYYSQTGRLKEIISNFTKPWSSYYNIDFVEIKCAAIPFPMSYNQFFEIFPETVLKLPLPIDYTLNETDYDCIIWGFQPWFVHISIPINSFIQTGDFRKIVKNKPVILVVDSRSTWRNSLKEVIEATEANAGNIKGTFVFRDTEKNRSGLLSLLDLLSGKKKAMSEASPKIILQEVIDSAGVYGAKALETLNEANHIDTIIPHIGKGFDIDKEFASIQYEQHFIDKYQKWAAFISKNNFKHRKFKLFLFKGWLSFVFFILTPLIAKKVKK
jgi:hypothetical protein